MNNFLSFALVGTDSLAGSKATHRLRFRCEERRQIASGCMDRWMPHSGTLSPCRGTKKPDAPSLSGRNSKAAILDFSTDYLRLFDSSMLILELSQR